MKERARVLEAARDEIARAERILCDVDGCLLAGDRPVAGAAEFVRRHAHRLHLVSNNSTDSRASLSRRLARLGLEVPPERIALAGELMVEWLAQRMPGAAVLMIATPDIRALARAHGVHVVDARVRVDAVALARDTRVRFSALQRAVRAASAGGALIVSNADATHPGKGGVPMIETGALLALLRACLPGVTPTVLGKPGDGLFRRALESVAPDRAVMIGDNPDTDIAGAAALGMPGVLVGRRADAVRIDELIL